MGKEGINGKRGNEWGKREKMGKEGMNGERGNEWGNRE